MSRYICEVVGGDSQQHHAADQPYLIQRSSKLITISLV